MDSNIDLSATLDDIVFEQRNKAYGAYFLRKLYDRNILIAGALSIAVFTLVLLLPIIFKKEEVKVVKAPKKEVKLIDIALDAKVAKPLPLPETPPPTIKQMKFIAFEPDDDNKVKEKVNFKIDSANISTINKEGKDTVGIVPPIVPIGIPVEEPGDGLWLGAVTKEAGFPGGNGAMANYIKSHISQRAINYVQDRGVKGRIYVSFEVNKDGSIENVQVIQGREIPNCKICSEAAIEVIQKMDKWTPAENNGNPVKRKIQIPIAF